MAEGVEDTDGLRLATSLGVEFVQGFPFGRPATRRSVLARLHQDRDRRPAAPRPLQEPEPTGTGPRRRLRGLR
ncbi:MAG: hypothetical protein R2715_01690 [Ilumatobacteraceae bacterium]